jgi:hypothetical protein
METLTPKATRAKRTGGVTQVVEHLVFKHESPKKKKLVSFSHTHTDSLVDKYIYTIQE